MEPVLCLWHSEDGCAWTHLASGARCSPQQHPGATQGEEWALDMGCWCINPGTLKGRDWGVLGAVCVSHLHLYNIGFILLWWQELLSSSVALPLALQEPCQTHLPAFYNWFCFLSLLSVLPRWNPLTSTKNCSLKVTARCAVLSWSPSPSAWPITR